MVEIWRAESLLSGESRAVGDGPVAALDGFIERLIVSNHNPPLNLTGPIKENHLRVDLLARRSKAHARREHHEQADEVRHP